MTIYDNDSGLVSLWRLNESSDGTSAVKRSDSVAANHLTDNNTVASSLTAKEGSRSASFVAANNEYLSITDAAQSGLNITPPFSIVLWVKFNALGTVQYLLDKAVSPRLSYDLWKRTSDDIRLRLSSDGTTSTTFTSTISILDTDWHHIAVVADGFTVEIYIDGANVSPASNSWTDALFVSSEDFFIGANGGTAFELDGLLDEVAIFNRALLQTEVQSIKTFNIRPARVFPARYKIELRNTSGTLVAEIVDFFNLSLTHRLNEVPTASLSMFGEDSRVSLFVEDFITQIYRDVTHTSSGWYKEWDGFFVDIDPISTDASGKSLFVAKLFGNLDLVKRRYIFYPSGSSQAKKTGPGETVIKEYVDENLGAIATVPPRKLYSGVMSNITIEADGATGTTWSGEDKSWQSLHGTIKAVAAGLSR
jgi:hypothetical protein